MKVLFCLLLFSVFQNSYSQVKSQPRLIFHNSLNVSTSARHHFDGNPNSIRAGLQYSSFPINIQLNKTLGLQSCLMFEYDFYRKLYDYEVEGKVMRRFNYLFTINYFKLIYSSPKIRLFWGLGAMHRRGFETMYINRYFFHINVLSRLLRDWGPTVGLQFQRDIGKRWRLLAKTDYTYYAYVRHKGSVYDFDEGATRHLARVHLGVGYKFNFNFRREKHDD